MLELQVYWTYVRGVLASESFSDRERLEFCADIVNQAELAEATSKAVVDTLRLEVGQHVEAEAHIVHPAKWLERVVNDFQAMSSRHEIELSFPDAIQPVQLDEMRATAVLVAILTNALKFSSGGTISVNATCPDNSLVIEVQDEGPGVPSFERTHVFSKGFRGAGTTRLYGSGMGLYVASRIAREVLGGAVTLEESARGAKFRFELPVSMHLPAEPADLA
jgi:two-component system sensor histidine kinase KdpD